jgi:hypothetical protein
MQLNRSIVRVLLVFVCLSSSLPALGQEWLLQDADYPVRPLNHPNAKEVQPSHRAAGTTTFAPLPFVDDFSYDSLFPSRALWAVPGPIDPGQEFVPGISTRKGSNVRSKGVCSFDGATAQGNLYRDELAFGLADSLVSLPFDLSTLSPSDSLYLSFYVQRGGIGDAPESNDSLVLYFDSSGTYQYEQVWALRGNGNRDVNFRYVEIPIREPRYFSNGFRFRFANWGSLNGEYDVFHLDYVVLRRNRFMGDSTATDVSPTHVNRGPMGWATAVPRDHFGLAPRMDTCIVRIANVSSPTMTTSATLQISDPRGGNVFSGVTSQGFGPLTLAPGANGVTFPTNPFSEQTGSFASNGAVRLRTISSAPGDLRPLNDTLDFYCDIDSTLGYDDGVSDGAYGLTSSRSFCQEYKIPAQDTLTAVWIYFTPYLYYNPANGQSNSLANKNFRLSIWDTLSVDSFVVQTSNGMNVQYDSTLNSFNRYALSNPIIVDTLFWVGIRQIDGVPLGVGFDRNFVDASVYYEALSGDFVRSSNPGTLMIRPEFGHRALSVGQTKPHIATAIGIQAFPHPWVDGDLTIRLSDAKGLKDLQVRIFSLEGRLLYAAGWPAGSTTLSLPESLRDSLHGLNLIQISGKASDGSPLMQTQRLLVQSPE